MANKEYTLADVEKGLRTFMQNKGDGFWKSRKGVAAINKAFARHKAIYDLQTAMLNRLIASKRWYEKWHESEFAKILVAYPVCTHRDHEAMNGLAVVINDLDRAKFSSYVGRLTQRRSGKATKLKSQDEELERVYLGYMKDHPKASIEMFKRWYKNTDNAQTNNLDKRLGAIRKKNGMSR